MLETYHPLTQVIAILKAVITLKPLLFSLSLFIHLCRLPNHCCTAFPILPKLTPLLYNQTDQNSKHTSLHYFFHTFFDSSFTANYILRLKTLSLLLAYSPACTPIAALSQSLL